MDTILKQIMQARKPKKWTYRELARLADLDQSTLISLANGKTKARQATLNKIADALGVSSEMFSELRDTTAPERGRKGGLGNADGLTEMSNLQAVA